MNNLTKIFCILASGLAVQQTAGGTPDKAAPATSTAAKPALSKPAPIRSVFQTVDLTPGLRSRTQTLRLYPVQAIALGKGLTILGVGGNPLEDFLQRLGQRRARGVGAGPERE